MVTNENIEILQKIKNKSLSFTNVEREIAEYIIGNLDMVPNMSIKELAAKANVSEAGITRFCRKIGIDGFKLLKMELVKDITISQLNINNAQSIIRIENDDVFELFQGISNINKKAIDDTKLTLDKRELEKAIEAMVKCKSILFFGVGGSNPIALDAFNKFIRIGFDAKYCSDFHMINILTLNMTKKDILVLISTSGMTKDIIEIANVAKYKGTKIIAITQFGKTPLYKLADIKLCIPYLEEDFRIGSMPSRIALLNIIDSLYLAICNKLGSIAIKKIEESRKSIIKLRR